MCLTWWLRFGQTRCVKESWFLPCITTHSKRIIFPWMRTKVLERRIYTLTCWVGDYLYHKMNDSALIPSCGNVRSEQHDDYKISRGLLAYCEHNTRAAQFASLGMYSARIFLCSIRGTSPVRIWPMSDAIRKLSNPANEKGFVHRICVWLQLFCHRLNDRWGI